MKNFLKLFWAVLVYGFYCACTKAAHLQRAIVQNPVTGRTKKSAGGMTFVTLFSQNVMKAKVFSVRDKNSPAQQLNRSLQKKCVGIAKGFKDIAQLMYDVAPTRMSCYSDSLRLLMSDMLKVGNKHWTSSLVLGHGDDLIDAMAADMATQVGSEWTMTLSYVTAGHPTSFNPITTLIVMNLTQGLSYHENVTPVLGVCDINSTFPSNWAVNDNVIVYWGFLTQPTYGTSKFKPGADLANKVK